MEVVRHSLAHLLAATVKEYDPEAKLAIGPTTEHGFYYDFEFSEGKTPGPEELKGFQKRMKKLASSVIDFSGREITPDEAREMFSKEPYKLELIEEFAGEGQALTAYTSGDFTDLCRGGHVKNTGEINPDAFALTHIAGAYWRGDENKPMLTRIYGVAFGTKEELAAYNERLAEAERRDHRKLGKELDLFTFSPLVGSGLPLFTAKGARMRELIADRIQKLQEKFGFERVWIPHIAKRDLYETSGHWDKFKDDLFHVRGRGEAKLVMKPMNCPHHTQIYAHRARSYRDLPIRFAEVTTNYRDEQPGELLGLSRVRSLTQDDGHVFCTIGQVKEEARNIISVIRDFYTSLDMFGAGDYWVSLSVRDPEAPEKFLGDASHWDKAEALLEGVAHEEKLDFTRVAGEAAFYGPKLDFMFKDALGRQWQLATIQLDLVMPMRFGLAYKAADGTEQTPVMIHRAIAGSLERFMAVVIEHFAGAFPTWISPVQVKVLPIGEAHREYARSVYTELREAGIRTELDESDETLGKKIRNAKTEKVPYFLVLGDQERDNKHVMAESRDGGKVGAMEATEFINRIKEETSPGDNPASQRGS